MLVELWLPLFAEKMEGAPLGLMNKPQGAFASWFVRLHTVHALQLYCTALVKHVHPGLRKNGVQ